MRFELVRDVSVVKSGSKGLIDRLRLNETLSEIRVGRTSANQMRLQPEGKESMGLSRYHARFVKSKKDGWMLIDNKSTNGTYINSIKIPQMKPVELAPNDVIVFGGGGSQAVGGRKRQRTSPFRFFYRKCQDSNNDRTNRSTLSTSKSETKSRSSPPLESRQTIPDSSQENMPTETKPSTAVVNQITDTLTCSLCMELSVHAVNLPCGHSCCWMCWDEWSEKKKNCPLCRKEVENETNVVRNFCCDQMVDLIVNQDGYEKEELDVFKERKAESEKFIKAKKKRARSASSVSNRNSTTTTTSARSEKKRRRQRDTSVH